MSAFALVGALGAIANVLIVWVLVRWGVNYVVAAVVAAEVTIVANFLMFERSVFSDMTGQASDSRRASPSRSRSTMRKRWSGSRSWPCWSAAGICPRPSRPR